MRQWIDNALKPEAPQSWKDAAERVRRNYAKRYAKAAE
jgi:hypothetical protein